MLQLTNLVATSAVGNNHIEIALRYSFSRKPQLFERSQIIANNKQAEKEQQTDTYNRNCYQICTQPVVRFKNVIFRTNNSDTPFRMSGRSVE